LAKALHASKQDKAVAFKTCEHKGISTVGTLVIIIIHIKICVYLNRCSSFISFRFKHFKHKKSVMC